MSGTQALVFDLDGVLALTIDLHYRAWKQLAGQHNLTFTPADMERVRGKHRRDAVTALFAPQQLTDDQINAYAEIKHQHYRHEIEHATPSALVARGTHELIARARAYGLKVGVASSSTNAIATLIHTGLYDLFDAVADGDTVTRSKPAPDIFVWIAGALRVSPQRVIVFEDAAAGITGAQAAGMFTVGVGSLQSIQHADWLVPALEDVDLDQILAAACEGRRAIAEQVR